MSLLSSLDAKDRRILFWAVGVALSLAVLIGFLLPNADENSNPLPSTFLNGQHGAHAAYETLLNSGYSVERWERPLSELAGKADANTVVIFAQPFTRDSEDVKAVQQILEHGGRVLATNMGGALLLPGASPTMPVNFSFAACKLQPEGLDPLASSGTIWMVPGASWQLGNPAYRVQYSCDKQPAVVEYDWGKGHVVWWASSTPLENGSLARDQDLDLLLNSIGPKAGHHIYWDESLHGDVRSVWSYAAGPSLTLLSFGLPILGILIVLSFSRRSGPLRDEPATIRTAPVEFLEALGALYKSARASSTAVTVAYERFRRRMLRLCGLRNQAISAADLSALLRRRFPRGDATLEADLQTCEGAAYDDTLHPKAALKLIQALDAHEQAMLAASRLHTINLHASSSTAHTQEKAS
ncbi:MAG: DUF4350 domain-containing protein [Acidobacteriota bacterium]|nr:DUF4350 domain-containing protein [Acidobacteriota bacterium]